MSDRDACATTQLQSELQGHAPPPGRLSQFWSSHLLGLQLSRCPPVPPDLSENDSAMPNKAAHRQQAPSQLQQIPSEMPGGAAHVAHKAPVATESLPAACTPSMDRSLSVPTGLIKPIARRAGVCGTSFHNSILDTRHQSLPDSLFLDGVTRDPPSAPQRLGSSPPSKEPPSDTAASSRRDSLTAAKKALQLSSGQIRKVSSGEQQRLSRQLCASKWPIPLHEIPLRVLGFHCKPEDTNPTDSTRQGVCQDAARTALLLMRSVSGHPTKPPAPVATERRIDLPTVAHSDAPPASGHVIIGSSRPKPSSTIALGCKERNRQAQQRFRGRQKSLIHCLKSEITELRAALVSLSDVASSVQQENDILKSLLGSPVGACQASPGVPPHPSRQ